MSIPQEKSSVEKSKNHIQKQRLETIQTPAERDQMNMHKSNSAYVSNMVTEDGDIKCMWRFIKNKKCDSVGVAALKKEDLLHSNPSAKADILNEQFCSVFTEEDLDNLPDLGESLYPNMPGIVIVTAGVRKLMKILNAHKAAGADNIPCRLLAIAVHEIAPDSHISSNGSSRLMRSLMSGVMPSYNPFSKKVTAVLQQTTVQYP